MYIFRLEDPYNGKGPWMSKHVYEVSSEYTPNYCNSIEYPDLKREFMWINNEIKDPHKKILNVTSYSCALDSLERFLHWFPEKTLKIFHHRNLMIVVYKISMKDIVFGKKQIFFQKTKAEFVNQIKPLNYYELSSYEVD